ncbi:RagB/SusD family nutrient uptake outer membrane protein, partial [Flavobacteriaceae bacterium]|nr:RagB/SusD family nutrient uptake outer membrane protein [Flavobacteriaceae bacterium]
MKNFKIKLFLISLIVVCSCSDDFVNVESEDENSENFFNSEQDYQDALIATYDALQWTYLNV